MVIARQKALIAALLSLACLSACRSSKTLTPGQNDTPVRMLMLTATAGFRHDSINTARQVMPALASSSGRFTVTMTEDLAAISSANLAGYDVVFFALTSGELAFTDEQKAALLTFVSTGGGFLGVHSATDTLYNWPEYGQLVGAYFKEHPWTRDATVIVEDRTHPSTTSLPATLSLMEEYYTFRDNPRPNVQVLLRLDAASVGASGDYPLAWARAHGSGRAYYNALGHFASTWNDTRFQQQLLGAITWVGE
jgi:type 1 glutamine amidotransferase